MTKQDQLEGKIVSISILSIFIIVMIYSVFPNIDMSAGKAFSKGNLVENADFLVREGYLVRDINHKCRYYSGENVKLDFKKDYFLIIRNNPKGADVFSAHCECIQTDGTNYPGYCNYVKNEAGFIDCIPEGSCLECGIRVTDR